MARDLGRMAAALLGVTSFGCAVLGTGVATGGAATELRAPVERRCEEVRLGSCPDLVEGVLLYAARHPVEGKAALTRGASRNIDRPRQLRLFAESLLTLERTPNQHRKAVRPAADVLMDAAWEIELASLAAARTRARAADHDTATPTAASHLAVATPAAHRDTAPWGSEVVLVAPWADDAPDPMQDFNQLRSGVVEPTRAERASRCEFGGRPARCASQIPGRVLIEQLYVSPTCPYDVFVQRGVPEEPRWVVFVAAGKGIELGGARLPVEQGEFLVIGAVSNGSQPIEADARCGVTWVAAGLDRDRPPPNPYR